MTDSSAEQRPKADVEQRPEADAAGRVANDPSVKEHGLVPEALQCPHGKPDGEVDTGDRREHPASLFS